MTSFQQKTLMSVIIRSVISVMNDKILNKSSSIYSISKDYSREVTVSALFELISFDVIV